LRIRNKNVRLIAAYTLRACSLVICPGDDFVVVGSQVLAPFASDSAPSSSPEAPAVPNKGPTTFDVDLATNQASLRPRREVKDPPSKPKP
jgi:hypothetical protein